MMVIPSVDVKDGRCVKLVQGRPSTGLNVSDDPLITAKHWERQGAEMLHVVDLDGALRGDRRNRDLIRRVVSACSVPVQVGGGIRTLEDALSIVFSGALRVIVGTAALENPAFVAELAARLEPRKVFVSLDATRSIILKDGWSSKTEGSLRMWAKRFEAAGAGGFLYTDVTVEGTMSGPNLQTAKELVQTTSRPIVYAGGISSLEQLIRLAETGVTGAVVGMALYQGRFTLREAQEACRHAGR